MKTLVLWNKEMKIGTSSAMAYVVFTMFLLVVGILFYIVTGNVAKNAMFYGGIGGSASEVLFGPLFHDAAIMLMFFTPALTMRLFAEERRSGTLELLFTYPFRDLELLLGKYLSAVTLMALILLPTVLYPIFISHFAAIDWQTMAVQYLGLVLIGSACAAVGIWASSLTDNQIVAAMLALGILLVFWFAGWAEQSFPNTTWAFVVGQFSIFNHYEKFSKGVILISDISYYLFFIGLFLYFTLKNLEARTWRGAGE